MLRVVDLNFHRGKRKIIDNVSLSIKAGEFVAIVGKNGEGKSTLVDLLAGISKGQHKEISYNDTLIEEMSLEELGRIRALLSQKSNLQFSMTVYEFILLAKRSKSSLKSDDFTYLDLIIEEFDLEKFIDREISSLSGGEFQRVILAKTVFQLYPFSSEKSAFLFLDEPMSAMDLEVQQKMMRILKSLVAKYNLSIIVVLHDLNQVSHYCDRVLILSQGKICINADPDEAFTVSNLKKFFNLEVMISKVENKKVILY
ncbi:putative ABC transport, ATP-binding protein [Halobacteriovorax marinus SJ]|uniref:ABC transport, ATP-binding protein n=1 Tax=Halobacteriovorax marinus (strain ATCC BAA-682 / DSM 15412 / SJ) TaxID=862908 RepID=E1WX16_HALMS|nr:ATP-binding cassette domain-containing protein [Halobacteriovorax marinus]CBW25717.1 putative ABC transport, ATP-binding protein [Halobacteriovorax marinus SJ]